MKSSTKTGTRDILKAEAAMQVIPVSRHTLERLAEACGGKYRIGRSVFYDVEKILSYVKEQIA